MGARGGAAVRLLEVSPAHLVVHGPHLYWTTRDADGWAAWRGDRRGAGARRLGGGGGAPSGLAVAGDHVYVAAGDAVTRLPAAGGATEVWAADQPGARALVARGERVFWAAGGDLRVRHTTGGETTTLSRHDEVYGEAVGDAAAVFLARCVPFQAGAVVRVREALRN